VDKLWKMEDSDIPMEELPIGKIEYGHLECPGIYMIKADDDRIYKIKLVSETFATVKVRKFYSNKDSKGRLWVDYNEPKTGIINVVEHVIETEVIIEDEDRYEEK